MATTADITPEKNLAPQPHAPRDETLIESARASPAIAAPGFVIDTEDEAAPGQRYTKGEWFYTAIQQIGGKGAILASTAALAFAAKYGNRWYGWVPNIFEMAQKGFNKLLMENKLYHVKDKGPDWLKGLAGAASSTMLLFWGGTALAPVMKKMENNRENIANWYNRKFGTPEDVAIAHENLKDEPQQTWGDIFKGRIVAWLSIFTTFVAADMALGTGKLFGKGHKDLSRFGQYEEGFGRWMAGWLGPNTLGRLPIKGAENWFKEGKALWNIPLSKTEEMVKGDPKTRHLLENKLYKFGKITALDFYATNAGIIIWSFISRFSAKRRLAKEGQNSANGNQAIVDTETKEAFGMDTTAERKYTETIKSRVDNALTPPSSFSDKARQQPSEADYSVAP